MESFSYYRNRAANILEEAMTRYEKRSENPSVLLEQILASENAKSLKVLALLRLIRDVLPGCKNSKENLKLFRDLSDLPINPEVYEFQDLVGSGYESNVYLLESKNAEQKSLVMKVYQRLSGNVDSLIRRGRELNQEYSQIREWYKDIPDLVPTEAMIVARDVKISPIIPRENTLVIFQKFFGGKLKDLFRGFKPGELEKIIREDPVFAERLKLFAKISVQHEQETGEVVDTLGNNNVCVVRQGEKYSLIILDPHIIHSTRSTNEPNLEQIKKHLYFLSQLMGE